MREISGSRLRSKELLAAAGAAAAAVFGPPLLGLGPDDPLRGLATVLPLVTVGLLALESAVSDSGSRPPRRSFLLWIGGWILIAALRERLALPHVDPLVAAGLFAVFGLRVIRLLPRLLPLVGRPSGHRSLRPHPAFFVLPFLVYLLVLPWATERREPDGDEPHYLLVAHSIAFDGDTDLANNYAAQDSRRFMSRAIEPQPGDPVGPEGELYSRHAPLLPLVLALPYRLAGAIGAFVAMTLLSALVAWRLVALLSRLPLAPGGVLSAWSLTALAPPVLLFSHQVWTEVPAALLATVALGALVGPAGRRGDLVAAGALVLLPLLKLRFAFLAAGVVVGALLVIDRSDARRRRTILGTAVGLGAIGGTLLVSNAARFGAALRSVSLEAALDLPGFRTVSIHLAGLFVDAAFGLFAVCPLWIVLVPGLVLLVRRAPRWGGATILAAAPYLLIVALQGEWFGGWSPPFRYGVATLPLLAVPVAAAFEARKRLGARLVLGIVLPPSAVLGLAWLAVPGWTYDLADGSTHLLDHLAGRLELDVIRLFPSAVRPGPALGWWLVGVGCLAGLWLLPLRRRTGALRAGIALALAGLAAVPFLAGRLPTRIAEAEDPWISSTGGRVDPPEWTPNRVAFRGAWYLPEGEMLSIPVVPGGDRVTITLHVKYYRHEDRDNMLRLRAGGDLLRGWRSRRPRRWQRVTLGPFDWPAGEPLELLVTPGRRRGPKNAVVVDRVELEWE